jgi:hypothetical protein
VDRKGHGRSRSRVYCTAETLVSSREKLGVEPILTGASPATPRFHAADPRRNNVPNPLKNIGLRRRTARPPRPICKSSFAKIGPCLVGPRDSAIGAALAATPGGASAAVDAF